MGQRDCPFVPLCKRARDVQSRRGPFVRSGAALGSSPPQRRRACSRPAGGTAHAGARRLHPHATSRHHLPRRRRRASCGGRRTRRPPRRRQPPPQPRSRWPTATAGLDAAASATSSIAPATPPLALPEALPVGRLASRGAIGLRRTVLSRGKRGSRRVAFAGHAVLAIQNGLRLGGQLPPRPEAGSVDPRSTSQFVDQV